LDREHYGWWDWVDLRTLDMIHGNLCVVGQIEQHLSGSHYGLSGSGFGTFMSRYGFVDIHGLGFVCREGEQYAIRDMWRWEILARRKNPPKRPRLWWLTRFTHKFTKRDRDAEIW
jgi:hypothetical protein